MSIQRLSSILPKNVQDSLNWGSLYGSADALVLSEFIEKNSGVFLVITNTIDQCENLYNSLRFFSSHQIIKFDDWEILPYDHFSPHSEIISNRLEALSLIRKAENVIVVTTVEALLARICPIDFVSNQMIQLSIGTQLEQTEFSQNLANTGYRKVMKVVEPGEYSVKGSLIDLFPNGSISPYRIDLFDNEIESIRIFDPSTQRTISETESINLTSSKEFPADKESILDFVKKYKAISNRETDQVIDQLENNRLPGGIEFYLPLFFDKTNSLFDYFNQLDGVFTYQGFEDFKNNAINEINTRFEISKEKTDRFVLDTEEVYFTSEEISSYLKKYKQTSLSENKSTKSGSINFPVRILPPLQIHSESKNPIDKLESFLNGFDGKTLIAFESVGRQNVVEELLKQKSIKVNKISSFDDLSNSSNNVSTVIYPLPKGLLFEEFALITEDELFGEKVIAQKKRKRAKHKDFEEAIKSLIEINIGDPIVHENYGVGRYQGLKTQSYDGLVQDFLSIEYANETKLLIPVTDLNLISRYSGVNPDYAPLHKLGTAQWQNAKRKARESLHDVAVELLEIYSKRASMKGFSFPEPSDAYDSFVSNFQYEETPDQIKTILEVLSDMNSSQPMDRLVCGDVGFGKTEIAMRAAFLAVESGKQVAILVPTTLLANQHHQSFEDRFINFPVTIESLTRFKSDKKQNQVKQLVADGKVDILIGTHKIIQSSVKYKNLGLVIIDEEHRFGVRQKEALKKLRGNIDVLTMTATPIPRTLNMALGDLKSMSIISTPPANRNAINTFVGEWDDALIRESCYRELHRGGQVFFLHNDIDSIDNMAEKISGLVVNSRVRIAHGQMPSKELEMIMNDFYHGRFDILVCTTIIETGIDIPNANTILINNAQNFGLAQLHQLRGRVGRSHHLAYAYLIIKSKYALNDSAKKRLDAIESLEELGAGFMLANHDLEIRGAGNLLGDNQSGKINEIGFNLYHDLLKRTIESIRMGQKIDLDEAINSEPEIDVGISTVIPEDFLPDIHERLLVYKRVASCENISELDELQIEFIDRYGLLPDSMKQLFAVTELKLQCKKNHIQKLDAYDDKCIITFSEINEVNPEIIIRLIQSEPNIYQLKGESVLIIKSKMEEGLNRVVQISKYLEQIASN